MNATLGIKCGAKMSTKMSTSTKMRSCYSRILSKCEAGKALGNDVGRRKLLVEGGLLASAMQFINLSSTNTTFMLAKADEEPDFQVCREECGSLSNAEVKSTSTGLKYKDLKVGDGELPPTGYQILVNYVVMLPNGKVIDSTIDKGAPADIRVGTGSVIAGLDEGLLSMRSGGQRRLYIPGELSFQKRLVAAPGRPTVQAQANIIVDVELLYIPGLD